MGLEPLNDFEKERWNVYEPDWVFWPDDMGADRLIPQIGQVYRLDGVRVYQIFKVTDVQRVFYGDTCEGICVKVDFDWYLRKD